MPMAALAVFLMPLGLDEWPLRVMGAGIEFMLVIGRRVSALPGAVSVMPAWPVSALVLVSFGGLWLGLWRQRWRWLGVAPVLLGIALAYGSRPPDLLIARDGLTVALRAPDGRLKLLRPSRDKYAAAEWLKRDGDAHDAGDAIATRSDGTRCDALGCIARTVSGVVVANILRPDALAEDCRVATIVISAAPLGAHCRGPKFAIDISDIGRTNGYAIWLGPPLRIETVEQHRGSRPWSMTPP
jgi:competence protein ComEC